LFVPVFAKHTTITENAQAVLLPDCRVSALEKLEWPECGLIVSPAHLGLLGIVPLATRGLSDAHV